MNKINQKLSNLYNYHNVGFHFFGEQQKIHFGAFKLCIYEYFKNSTFSISATVKDELYSSKTFIKL